MQRGMSARSPSKSFSMNHQLIPDAKECVKELQSCYFKDMEKKDKLDKLDKIMEKMQIKRDTNGSKTR